MLDIAATKHFASSLLRTSIFQVTVVQPKQDMDSLWDLKIMGEVSTLRPFPQALLSSLSHFSVCVEILLSKEQDNMSTSCFPVDLFNFYSNIVVRSPMDVVVSG